MCCIETVTETSILVGEGAGPESLGVVSPLDFVCVTDKLINPRGAQCPHFENRNKNISWLLGELRHRSPYYGHVHALLGSSCLESTSLFKYHTHPHTYIAESLFCIPKTNPTL